jgi:glycine/D-amino acid oxidase-like deaminating enzyme
MKRIAVIGAGVFGSEIAIRLAEKGFQVTLIDKENNILMGTTPKSVLRLHLGFHYPRDLETAIQSRSGYQSFLERFSSSIDLNFMNYYAIAKTGSRVSPSQFSNFVGAAGLTLSEVPMNDLAETGFATHLVQAIYSNEEGVISIENLRKQFLNEMNEFGVERVLNTEILSAGFVSEKWVIVDSNDVERKYDFVVRATYGHDRIIISNVGTQATRRYEFHNTLVLDVDVNIPRIGMTIIDGDFLTVLPKANKTGHLIYAPMPSVMRRYTGENYPHAWDTNDSDLIRMRETEIIKRYKEWFTNDDDVKVTNRLITVRAIDSDVKETDRRISQLNMRAENFIDVNSGKIDHCVEIATKVVAVISKSF